MCAARCSLASAQIHNLTPGNLLPRVRSLFASSRTPHGVRAIMPWLSTSLEEVDVAFGPDVDDTTAISCLQLVQICTAVTALTFTLDSSDFSRRREGVVHALIGAIGAMPCLHKVSVPLELVTPDVLDALAALPNLHTLILTPATSPLVWEVVDLPSFIFSVTPDDSASSRETSQGSWSPGPRAQGQAELLDELSPMAHLQDLPFVCDAPRPIPHVEISRFSTLHNLQTSAASWAEVATIVRNMEPGLRHLVVFLPQAQSSLETAALETLLAYCPNANIDVRYV
ncbi:hypothetical protein FIBSPDRAFT_503999 [Athelia psychrophila]|uniref:Uncharacterized protein n=1 Tax=Athelia psychrophila TaxID=1759441 RepID=A0A166K6P9_9AGAM|nr:hypothetical protein FIBSPDRAFT_503999 [Fibularhizoctonia sp. CBS 109695]